MKPVIRIKQLLIVGLSLTMQDDDNIFSNCFFLVDIKHRSLRARSKQKAASIRTVSFYMPKEFEYKEENNKCSLWQVIWWQPLAEIMELEDVHFGFI